MCFPRRGLLIFGLSYQVTIRGAWPHEAEAGVSRWKGLRSLQKT
jgi:hypothetical protein